MAEIIPTVVEGAPALTASVDVLILGAGACGLTAALAAEGADVLVAERDAVPSGSTALSAGLIPAAGTRWQAEAGEEDSPARLAEDIRAKSKGTSDPVLTEAAAEAAGPAVTWLGERHGLPFELVDGFVYPGHSARRMHAMPERTGQALIDRLRAAAENAGVMILTHAKAHTLYVEGGKAVAVGLSRPDGEEVVGCRVLIIATNGYGGNKAFVAKYIPSLVDAVWFGHDGNDGLALLWGEALGADLAHLSGHQGHGAVAHPHGILITWATNSAGGFQVNGEGVRFHDETAGYSEAGAQVMAQPGGLAWSIFDGRIADIARQFEDFRHAEEVGAVLAADTPEALAERFGLPTAAFAATVEETRRLAEAGETDGFGRTWSTPPLEAPLMAVKVTAALFHTQGGLRTDAHARVLKGGTPLPNILAAGGAAVGVSGPDASGYLSGNGLLTAVAMGRTAGESAKRMVKGDPLD